MITFLQYLTLVEATAPFHKRLEWMVNNERDPVVALLAMDAILRPSAFIMASRTQWANGSPRLINKHGRPMWETYLLRRHLEDNWITNALSAQWLHPGSLELIDSSVKSPLTDDQIKLAHARLKQNLLSHINKGRWYNESVIPERSPWEKMVGWVAMSVKKAPRESLPVLSGVDGREITDWFIATRPNLMLLTPAEAAQQSDEWHRGLAQRNNWNNEKAEKTALDTSHLKNVATLNAGVEIFELTPADLKDEGLVMKHCIGDSATYAQELRSGKGRAFSVRRNKKRLYTVWTYDEIVLQFKGKTNTIPGQPGTDVDAAKQAAAWFESEGFDESTRDLSKI